MPNHVAEQGSSSGDGGSQCGSSLPFFIFVLIGLKLRHGVSTYSVVPFNRPSSSHGLQSSCTAPTPQIHTVQVLEGSVSNTTADNHIKRINDLYLCTWPDCAKIYKTSKENMRIHVRELHYHNAATYACTVW